MKKQKNENEKNFYGSNRKQPPSIGESLNRKKTSFDNEDKSRLKRHTLSRDNFPVMDQNSVASQRDAKLRAVGRRKERSRIITLLFFVLIIMVFTVFIILSIMKKTSPKPQFMFIQNGILEHTLGASGVIIRDDVVMKSPANGTVKPLIEEGNRVSYGQDIAIIIAPGAEESLAVLKNCEQQISDLQRSLIIQGKGPGARFIYDETDKDIAELIDLARKDTIKGSLLNMASYEDSILVLLERRDTRLLSIDFKDSRLNELKTQKAKLEKNLGLLSGTMNSKTSGIVSYHLDGQEEQIATKDILSLTVEQYQKFVNDSKIYLTTEKAVSSNESILRITSGFYQYFAFLLQNTSEDSFKIGDISSIKIPLDGTIIQNCQVVKSIPVDKNLLIVFQTDRQLDHLSDRRIFQADITLKSTNGLKIPFSSIINFDKDKMTGAIMIVSSGYTRLSNINIIDYDREYAIIESVKDQQYSPAANGYLVKNPESIKEGENIGMAKQ